MNAVETCSLCREPLGDPKDRLPYRNGTEMTHVHARCALHATHALQLQWSACLIRRIGPAFTGAKS